MMSKFLYGKKKDKWDSVIILKLFSLAFLEKGRVSEQPFSHKQFSFVRTVVLNRKIVSSGNLVRV